MPPLQSHGKRRHDLKMFIDLYNMYGAIGYVVLVWISAPIQQQPHLLSSSRCRSKAEHRTLHDMKKFAVRPVGIAFRPFYSRPLFRVGAAFQQRLQQLRISAAACCSDEISDCNPVHPIFPGK